MRQKTQKQFLQKNIVVFVLAIVCCLLWGSAFPVVKLGYAAFAISSGDTASQILFAGLRFALAGALAILIGSVLKKRFLLPQKASLPSIGKLALVQTIAQYLFFYIGLANTTAVKSAIIGGTSSFLAILIACFLFRQEKFTKAKFVGCLLGLSGIIVVNLQSLGSVSGFTFFGEGFILFSNIAYAMSSSMIKIYSKQEDPVVLSGYQFLFGGIVMTIVGLLLGGALPHITMQGMLMLIYLALVSAIAYSVWGMLLKYNPVSRVAVFGFMIPVCGVLLSALLLGETDQAFHLQSLLALLLVCAGIIIINKVRPPKKNAALYKN